MLIDILYGLLSCARNENCSALQMTLQGYGTSEHSDFARLLVEMYWNN